MCSKDCNCGGSCSCTKPEETKILKFEIEEELVLLIEKEFFEYNSLLELARQFTSDSPYKPDMERYMVVVDEYIEAYAKFSIALNQLVLDVCNENNLDRSKVVNSELEFQEGILILEFKK